jgi:hypothetical protein
MMRDPFLKPRTVYHAGLSRGSLDEAARQGFANGAFEDLAEDVPAVAEEFFPPETPFSAEAGSPPSSTLRDRLEMRLQNAASA